MVTLEQIRALEARVEKAVALIDKLRKENAELEQRLVEASRSDEQVKSAYSELERKTSASIQSASESADRIEDLAMKLAEAEERAAALDRKAQAAEAENATYRDRALAAEHRSADLESKAEELRHEQSRIEEGLTHALEKLDAFEDLVMGISVGNSNGNSAGIADGKQTAGEIKVEAVEDSSSTLASQASPFPGTSSPGGDPSPGGDVNELDIF